MKIYRLKREQYLPVSQESAWRFFSQPINLSEITPPWLKFRPTQKAPNDIYAGLIISYRLKPILGVPVTWISEITHVREPDYFVDEQRSGPYKFWHHQHFFKTVGSETQVRDVVHYAIGYGLAGRLVHRFMVSPKLADIFDYRHEKLKRMFRPPVQQKFDPNGSGMTNLTVNSD